MYTPPPIPSRNVYPNVNGAVSKLHLHNLEYQNGLNLHVLTPPPPQLLETQFSPPYRRILSSGQTFNTQTGKLTNARSEKPNRVELPKIPC